jgi:hypothetical protein
MGQSRVLAWTGLAVLALAALCHNLPRLSPGMYNWAEPGNVAAALAQGRGFSDPFDGKTGATAWVSPLVPLVEAAVFTVLGIKSGASAFAMLVLTFAGLACANALLLAALAPHGARMRFAASAAFLCGCALLPSGPFEVLSEEWLDIPLSALLLWAALEMRRSPGRRASWVLIAVAFVAPLENAGLAVAAALVIAVLAWRGRRDPRLLAVPAAAAAAALIAVVAWGARNAAALGRFIPLKSNGWFEMNLANVASADGLPRMETVLRNLPYFDVRQFNRYSAMGELAYVDTFRAPALAALGADPVHFAGNVLRRLEAATVFMRREGGGEMTDFHFATGDWARLVNSGELITIGPAGGLWTRIDAPPFSERLKFQSLGLRDEAAILRDWSQKRLAYDAQYFSTTGLALGFIIAGLPVLCLLVAAFVRGGSLAPPAAWAAAIAFGMLLPYVLVNHNERHQAPLMAMQAVAIGACAQAFADRARRPSPSP